MVGVRLGMVVSVGSDVRVGVTVSVGNIVSVSVAWSAEGAAVGADWAGELQASETTIGMRKNKLDFRMSLFYNLLRILYSDFHKQIGAILWIH